jgi:hypothetical protein
MAVMNGNGNGSATQGVFDFDPGGYLEILSSCSAPRPDRTGPGWVTLNWAEVAHAVWYGSMIAMVAKARKRQAGNGWTPENGKNPWNMFIDGSLSELAFAKHQKLWWDINVGIPGRVDFGDQCEVRSVDAWDRRLIVKPNESQFSFYVLVFCDCPFYQIRGWAWGHEVKREEFFEIQSNRPDGGAFYFPNRLLHPMETMPPIWKPK